MRMNIFLNSILLYFFCVRLSIMIIVYVNNYDNDRGSHGIDLRVKRIRNLSIVVVYFFPQCEYVYMF